MSKTWHIKNYRLYETKAMKLYDYAAAPNPRRARIFINEKKLDIETVQIDLMKREQFSDNFKNISPRCTVPVLELDDGTMLVDNAGIAAYLEAYQPEPALLGTSHIEKGLIADWNARCEYEGMGAVTEAFRNSAPGFVNRSINGPVPFTQVTDLIERGKQRTFEFFETLNNRLKNRNYVATDHFSVADITAFVVIDFAKWIEAEVPDELTHLKGWYERVNDRPSVKET